MLPFCTEDKFYRRAFLQQKYQVRPVYTENPLKG